MFYSHELLSLRHKGKLARCWLAGSVSDEMFKQMCKSSTVNGINLCDLCNEIISTIQIKNNGTNQRFSLYLSSQLMYGAAKILLYQTISLQNQIFQIVKKGLYYRNDKIYEIQNVSADLDSSLLVLQDKFNINNNMEVMMHDATCLDFGALTHEQLNFLHTNDDAISLEVFDRMHSSNLNLNDELSCAFDNNDRILTDLENFALSTNKNEMEISMSPIHDDISTDQAHQVPTLSEVTMQEVELEMRDLLTSQKRQFSEKKHTETSPKRRRLRFEDEQDIDKVVTAPITETAVSPISSTDYPLELTPILELAEKNLPEVYRKSHKKKVFADKNTKLNHKMIRRWINNINAYIMPLNIPNINMPMSDTLFKTPSTSFTSIYEKKWNKSLIALFHMHTVVLCEKKTMPMEYGKLLDKSTEFTRFDDKSNKTEELFSELSSALGKSTELSKNTTSEKSITIAMDEFPEIPKVHDIMESVIDVPKVIIHSPDITDTSHNSSKLLSSYLVTKQELFVLLEIIWQNTDFAKFSDVVSSDHYSKLDASLCFTFLLELHKEKRIILKQAVPYDIIWIQKYA